MFACFLRWGRFLWQFLCCGAGRGQQGLLVWHKRIIYLLIEESVVYALTIFFSFFHVVTLFIINKQQRTSPVDRSLWTNEINTSYCILFASSRCRRRRRRCCVASSSQKTHNTGQSRIVRVSVRLCKRGHTRNKAVYKALLRYTIWFHDFLCRNWWATRAHVRSSQLRPTLCAQYI